MQVESLVTCWCFVQIGETLEWVSNEQQRQSGWYLYSRPFKLWYRNWAFSRWLQVEMCLVDIYPTLRASFALIYNLGQRRAFWGCRSSKWLCHSPSKTSTNSVSCNPGVEKIVEWHRVKNTGSEVPLPSSRAHRLLLVASPWLVLTYLRLSFTSKQMTAVPTTEVCHGASVKQWCLARKTLPMKKNEYYSSLHGAFRNRVAAHSLSWMLLSEGCKNLSFEKITNWNYYTLLLQNPRRLKNNSKLSEISEAPSSNSLTV